MARSITITDEKRRDAGVELISAPSPKPVAWKTSTGKKAASRRLIKSPEGHTWSDLLASNPDIDAVAQSLVDGDPEVSYELVGRKVGPTDRVWLSPDSEILYSARMLEVVFSPTGEEKERNDFTEVEATVGEDHTLPWSGRLFPIQAVIHKFALVRTLQIRHTNGLTFDFLRGIAQTLHESKKMLFLGSGAKGTGPLIFNRNGSPYRGFLEGRIVGEGFMLLLHLSNLEIKKVTQ